MQEIIEKLLPYASAILQLIGGLVIVATIIARVTPSEADDKYVDGFAEKFFKFMAWLPTFGVNPQTKKIQEAYEDLKAKNESGKTP